MKKAIKGRRARRLLRVLCTLPLAALWLTGCTVQSTQLGERAMVRLVYLDAVADGYNALCVVCDFAPSADAEQDPGAAVVLSAQGQTAEEALYQAAGARGGDPFFAQNRLLLLGPHIDSEQLAGLLAYFSADCGAYRDPAVWLWLNGEEPLAQLEDPMAFVQLAEQLTENDPLGCVCRVLDSTPGDATVLPVLRMDTAADGRTMLAKVGGLGVFTEEGRRLYAGEALLQGYGLLRGGLRALLLPVECDGQLYTLRLEALTRNLSVQQDRLQLTVGGQGSAFAQDNGPDLPLQAAADRALCELCTDAWQLLSRDGALDLFDLDWWAAQLGAPPTAEAAPAFAAQLRLD